MIDFIIKYKFILLFYAIVILFLILNRKKIQTQAKIIFLYRMKWGLKWMDKYSHKFKEWVILLGYIGVGAGFVGLIFISYLLIKNLINLISQPTTASGVSLVLPGVDVPGLGILPFWYWLIAIFVIAIVHEFAHGIVARAHNVEVKNTGIVLLGPIIGAFVEPNEEKLGKETDIKRYSVLAAGAFANILLAGLVLFLMVIVTSPLQQGMIEPTGFTFDQYYSEDFPIAEAGIKAGTLITGINDKQTTDFQQFNNELLCAAPGQKIEISTSEGKYDITLAANPENPEKGFLGIQQIRNEFEVKEQYQTGLGKASYFILDWLNGFFRWLFILSFGIGLFNLLPLPIVDGGRMAQVFFHRLKGKDKGEKIYRKTGIFFLLLLLVNLLYPLIAKLF